MESYLIKDAKIYTATNGVIEKGDVLVEDGYIKAVGENIKADGAEVISAEGMNLFPGFIDAHCHLGLWEDSIGFEGDDGNEVVDPVTPHLRAIDAINPMDRCFEEALEGGVTTAMTGPGSANVIGGQFAIIKTCGNCIDDMLVKETAAMKIAFGENPKRCYSGLNKSPSTRMATAAILRETLFKAKEYYEKVQLAEKEGKDKPAFDMKMEALLPVLKKEIPLKAHAHRADDIFTAIRIAKEFDVNLTLDHCTEGHLIVDELVRANKPALVGPTFGHRSKVELKNLSFETPGVLNEAGIKVAIITDSPVIPLQYLPMCAGMAVRSGMKEEEALKAITINPAEILGIDKELGSIEKGKKADLALFVGNPMFDVDYKPVMTFIDGKIAFQRR
jgi:imidazolonepropionase-like amidohydrolase